MCSIDLDDLQQMVKGRILSGNESCRKCTEPATLLLRGKDAYCSDCFLVYFVHKFRSTIGKSKQLKPNDNVLVCFSGGKNSSALLHLIRQGLNEDSHKRLRFLPTFLHIVEKADDFKYIKKLCSEVLEVNFKCYFVYLHQVMREDSLLTISEAAQSMNPQPLSEDEEAYEDLLKSLLVSCSSRTALEDLSLHLRYDLMVRTASQLGFSKVFLGDNATHVSTRILTHIALGRGSQLAEHVQFKSVHSGVQIFRPMRELLDNEVDHYNRICRICTPSCKGTPDPNSSIHSCSNNFILGLQEEFPATVPTVFKTGDKLVSTTFHSSSESNVTSSSTNLLSTSASDVSHLDDAETHDLCLLCGFTLDAHQGLSSALKARQVSKEISALRPGTPYAGRQQSANEEESRSRESFNDDGIQKLGYERFVCYGCRNILQEMQGEHNFFSKRIARSLQKKMTPEEMRNKFEDFLIK